jgi:hypothetical protein
MEGANFTGANFMKGAHFNYATFMEPADFLWASIGRRVVFLKINWKGGWLEPPVLKFEELQFQEKGVLRFQDMSLAQVKFAGTDLRRPEFHHVTWLPYRGRQAVYDEILVRRQEKAKPWFWNWFLYYLRYGPYSNLPIPYGDKYGEVERLYRNLEVNYEDENDFKSSGDFHYGEMEMHRRASTWRWFPLYWYNVYWLSSGYGERPLRSVLTLTSLLLAFSGFFLWVEGAILGGWSRGGFWEAFLYVFQ